ncbi:tumor suppressor, Mitostatin-domain-containing protein [Gaertneriomyces semiglobifer]|nr:tumor suppressor, Mitostatin-domain-containing protein [Gaertneriomyces semiglobifer]
MAATAHYFPHHRSDRLITLRREQEARRNEMLDRKKYYEDTESRSDFELRGIKDRVRREVFGYDRVRAGKRHQTDESRDVRSDEEDNTDGAKCGPEGLEDTAFREQTKPQCMKATIESMRERVNSIRQKREEDRKKVVEEKLLQRWRLECDELRSLGSSIVSQQIKKDRDVQVKELAMRRENELREKQYYDTLWEMDRQQKIQREERDRALKAERNKLMTETLQEQLRVLRHLHEEAARLKREEGELMRQENELRVLEAERQRLAKIEQQRLTRLELDAFNSAKIAAKRAAQAESLKHDLDILNTFFRMDNLESQRSDRKKEERRREMESYMAHIRALQAVEKERESEADRLYAMESDRLWAQRSEKYQKEQAARDKLMQTVLAERDQQLRERLDAVRAAQIEAEIEAKRIEAGIESYQKEQKRKQEERLIAEREYKEVLDEQVEARIEQNRMAKESLRLEEEEDEIAREKYNLLLELEMQRIRETGQVVGLNMGKDYGMEEVRKIVEKWELSKAKNAEAGGNNLDIGLGPKKSSSAPASRPGSGRPPNVAPPFLC